MIRTSFVLTCLLLILPASAYQFEPVSPNASAEASALLDFISSISGKYMLTGQHNYPNTKDRNTQFAAYYTGKTPVVYSIDWGHAREGDSDSYLARPDIVKECIRQHSLGSLITICWHAVPPTAEEPITFRALPDSDPDSIQSVQGKLTDRQFRDVLTPGTALYKQWCKQVDSVVVYLKQLQDAHVPVLWRPYHEMNGNWFWWGARTGEYSTRRLYIQLFDRLVKHHKLNNLVWVWSVDRFDNPAMYYEQYYPGKEYVDILSLDVYGNDFKKTYYDSLKVLADGKPIALAEVGNPPALEILDEQPDWAFYVIWADMVRNTLKKQYDVLFPDPRFVNKEDSIFLPLISSYRLACGLNPLPEKEKSGTDFNGTWHFSEEESQTGDRGTSQVPPSIVVEQSEDKIHITRQFLYEYASTRTEETTYSLNGEVYKSTFWDSPRETTVKLSESGDSLKIESHTRLNRGGRAEELSETEEWTLLQNGNLLQIHMNTDSPWGKHVVMLIYKKAW
ncbi:MAG: hypothetical protein JW801_16520 [Bacteroidales bacterium]|nr:hypothetical protein [Bacteroidales bacterium]